MAQIIYNVPNAALSELDAYAQELGFADFRAYQIDWVKRTARMVRRRNNEQQAKVLIGTEPPEVVVT